MTLVAGRQAEPARRNIDDRTGRKEELKARDGPGRGRAGLSAPDNKKPGRSGAPPGAFARGLRNCPVLLLVDHSLQAS